MFNKNCHWRLTGAFATLLGVFIIVGCLAARADESASSAATTSARLVPGPNDARIAYVTARLLEEFHYLQRPLDKDLSAKFFDGYIDSLDPRHDNFLQSDLAEFDRYRTNLDLLTVGGEGAADLAPAFNIFERFIERAKQHTAYADELLDEDKFKFTSDEKIALDRRHAPFPKDLDEAEALWRQRVRYEYLQEKLILETSPTNGEIITLPRTAGTNIVDTLRRHYQWNLHQMTNWDSDNVLQFYLDALAHAYDPHSDYLNMAHAQDFSINMSLALFGIGAQLGEDDGYCTIRELINGGPAEKSKQLKSDDRIVAVAQGSQPPVDVVDMDLDKVVQLIRGAKGTEVRLTISPAEDRAVRRIVSLTRDEIKLEDQEAKAKLVEMPNDHGGTNRIGVIDLPSFYASIPLSENDHTTPRSTSVDVTKLVNRLKQENVDAIILDLRNNPGGSLEEAVKFTGLFIKDGPVVQARNSDGQNLVYSDTDPSILYDGPLAVMINRFSASASEIAAAALQDYGRAIIVGDPTHGKGTVQNLNQLKPFVWPATRSATNDPGTIKITIRKFYRVSGASTQLKGVVPDITLPDPNIMVYSSQAGESALDNPLPWDTIQPASYDKLNLVEPYLMQLRARSAARVATNLDFTYIKQDIAQFQKLEQDQTASLNERESLKERQHINEQNKSRDAERDARPPLPEKIYDITLENVDQPGLTLDTNLTQASVLPTATNAIISATSTNAVAAVPEKKSPPPVDATLEETEHIMEDYIQLLSAGKTLTATK